MLPAALLFLVVLGDLLVSQHSQPADKRRGHKHNDGEQVLLGPQGVSPYGGGDHRRDSGHSGDKDPGGQLHGRKPHNIGEHVLGGSGDEKEDKADICLRLRPVDSLPEMSDHGHWAECHYYETGERDASVYYSTQFRGAPYACVRWSRDGARCECIYLRGKEYCLNYSRNIWDILGMETILLRNSGLLLHSSFIRCQGQAILFSAPCGTGKSTQAELWEKYEGADIINGDRAGLRNLDGVWKAFGLPYAGSSKIYRNESAPLGAIVLLRQAKDNHLRRLCPVEAFPDLYREITVHRWDRQFVENSTALLLRLLEDIPVYLLECRPDREAVEIVRNEIFGNNAEGKGEA